MGMKDLHLKFIEEIGSILDGRFIVVPLLVCCCLLSGPLDVKDLHLKFIKLAQFINCLFASKYIYNLLFGV